MKRVFFKMFGWLFNAGIASQCFSLCLTATLLPHINCSFVSPSALCFTTALCRKLRHHEHSTCHSMYTHVCHILSPTDRFACNDSTPWKNISKVVGRCAKKKKKVPFVTFHPWHVRAMFMQIGGEQHWLFCSRRPKQSNFLGMTDES